MNDISFKEKLTRGEILLGSLLTLPSMGTAEIMSKVGFDWLWIEMEHSPISIAQAQEMMQAVGGRIPCLVRAPWNDSIWIKHVLDTGCDGIVVPQIRSAVEAQKAINACMYPPVGTRSVGIGRAQGYGMNFQDYIDQSNERLIIILQTEHIDAVDNIESILDVSEFDAILIGPYDLSASMGLTGQITHPDVQAAIGKIKKACAARKMPVGVFAVDAQTAKTQIDGGCTLIALGVDTIYLWKSAKQTLDEMR